MELKPKSKREIRAELNLMLKHFVNEWEGEDEIDKIRFWLNATVIQTMLIQIMLNKSYNQMIKLAKKYNILTRTYKTERLYFCENPGYIMGIK